MGFLDRLFGRGDNEDQRQQREQSQWEQQRRQDELRRGGPNTTRPMGQPQEMTDEQAVERYRYMLQTAPPETIEEAHAEAFAKLSPEQRQMVLQELTKTLPEQERQAGYSNDPRSLARMATRAEMRQPGTIERTFSGNQGIGMGSLMAGSFFSSFAGMMMASMVANAFFGGFGNDGSYADGYQDGQNADSGDTGDSVADYGDTGGNYDGGDYGGGDYGGGLGDFGGGDFGGGDFGGGDF